MGLNGVVIDLVCPPIFLVPSCSGRSCRIQVARFLQHALLSVPQPPFRRTCMVVLAALLIGAGSASGYVLPANAARKYAPGVRYSRAPTSTKPARGGLGCQWKEPLGCLADAQAEPLARQ